MYRDFNKRSPTSTTKGVTGDITPRETLSLANFMYFQKSMLRKIGKLITKKFWTLSFFFVSNHFFPPLFTDE